MLGWWRRLRTLIWTALTLVTVLLAVVVGIGKLLMPYSVNYKPQLEAWLSRQFNQPVLVDSFTGEWRAFGPYLDLRGVQLQSTGNEPTEFALQRAALALNPLNLLLPGRPLFSFRIIGAELTLVRSATGEFELSGLGLRKRVPGPGASGGLRRLASAGEVRLEDSGLRFEDAQNGTRIDLIRLEGRLQLRNDEMALQLEGLLTGPENQQVWGELGAVLVARLDQDQRLTSLEWQAGVGELLLAELGGQMPAARLRPASGRLNAKLWGDWAPDQPTRVEGVVDLREVALDTGDALLELEHLNTMLRWRSSSRQSWRLDLADVQVREHGRDWTSPRLSVERNLPGGLGLWVSADYLDVDFPLQATVEIMQVFGLRWPANAPRAGQGVVRDFDLLIDSRKQFVGARGQFTDTWASDWGRWPDVQGITGEADLMFGTGSIRFAGDAVRVDWPRNFRAPLDLVVPGCAVDINWVGRGESWQMDFHDCAAHNPFLDFEGRLRFAGNRQGKPAVDVNVSARRLALGELDAYWPASIIKPATRGWLERALVQAEAANTRFLLQGDMDDFPFRDGEGSLEARSEISGGVLDYAEAWPAAREVDALVRFSGTRLEVAGSIGDLAGNRVDSVRAVIANLQSPRLRLDYTSEATLPQLAVFLGQSPLLQQSEFELETLALAGPAGIKGRLDLPLRAGGGERLQLKGEMQLKGNRLEELRSGQVLEQISGSLDYDQDGFRGSGLEASYLGEPGELALQSAWKSAELFHADLQGAFPVEQLLANSPLAGDPLLERMQGTSDWHIGLSVLAGEPDAGAQTWLELASELEGIRIDLPAPLAKPPEARWPLKARYPLGVDESAGEDPQLGSVTLGNWLAISIDPGAGSAPPVRAVVNLGRPRADLPAPGLFAIHGETERLDLDGWQDLIIEYARREQSAGALQFGGARVQAAELVLLNRLFTDTQLVAISEGDLLSLTCAGEALAGDLRYQRNPGGSHSLTAELERLWLGAPLTQGVNMGGNPAELPEMHLLVEDFRFLGLDLGQARIEAFPTAEGLRIESATAASGQLNLEARGDWINTPDGPRSRFDIVLTSESLGALVSALKLSSVLEGGQSMIRYDASWPGSPAAFAMETLNGKLDFSISGGRILTAEPGAGRVLGLMSIAALPRRLALDFSDVFASGFAFDQAVGSVTLDTGIASTSDLKLESTAATLAIEGSSNLLAKTFDYRMTVRPGVSQALPVLGAIAAGPPGAAAGLALQGLLRKSLGDAAEAVYAIKGPWAEPEITRLEVSQRQSASDTSPAPQADPTRATENEEATQ